MINSINNKISKYNDIQLESDEIETDEDDLICTSKIKNVITDTMDESGREEDTLKFNSEITELQEKEIWKNKAQSPKKRKSLYLVNHPEIK